MSASSSYGLGVEVTGSTANWPAFWSTGSPWPNNGEIDLPEGQEDRSCEQTHYGGAAGKWSRVAVWSAG